MSLPLFVLFFATIFASPLKEEQKTDVVRIGVLFEALCPDSVQFILGPLSDARDEFEQRIRLEMVPYGKAKIHENGDIVCQHGKYECQINKFLSCVINYVENALAFIICLETQLELYAQKDPVNWKQKAEDCFLLVDIASDTIASIRRCADGHEGNALQQAAANRTRSIMPDRVLDQYSRTLAVRTC